MMEVLSKTYYIVLPIALGYIVWLLQQQRAERKEQKKKDDANARGTMLLLRVQLIEYHDRFVAKGKIPSYAYENFCEMYKTYQDLGGNGMIVKMHDEVCGLPIMRKEDNHEH